MGSRSAAGAVGGTTGLPWSDRLQPLVCGAERRARIGVALVGPERHGPLRQCRDGQRGVDPEIRRDGRTVNDVESRVAVHAVVGVHDPRRGSVTDCAAAEEVRGHRDVEDLADTVGGEAVDMAGQSSEHLCRNGYRRRVGSAFTLPGRHLPPPERGAPGMEGDRVVQVLHGHRGDAAL